MRTLTLAALLLALPPALAQKGKKLSDEEFVTARPAVGDVIPDVSVFDQSGKELKTSSLRGHYTVLTFGCLT